MDQKKIVNIIPAVIVIILAGIVVSTPLVKKYHVEFGRSRANTTSTITFELDLPSYYPDFLRHPQKFVSGQPIRINAVLPDQKTVTLTEEKTRKVQSLAVKPTRDGKAFSVPLPADLPTGRYTISFKTGGQERQVQLAIFGLTEAEKSSATAVNVPDPLQRLAIKYRTKICDYCYWEMVFTGDPSDSLKLFHVNAGDNLSRSVDGGRTWDSADINTITTYPVPNVGYNGDSKLAALKDGSVLLSSLYWDSSSGNHLLGGMLYQGLYSSTLTASIFKNVATNPPPSGYNLVVDFPKIAVDEVTSSSLKVYISGNAVWFGTTQQWGYGLFVSQDGGQTFSEYQLNYNGTAIFSTALGPNSELYASYYSYNNGYYSFLMRFTNIEPPVFDSVPLPGFTTNWPPRVSSISSRAWLQSQGPQIVADTSPTSPHLGRLYAIWAQDEKAVPASDFQYSYYGYNYDVFVSYSDDKGQTWSSPVKVNDDNGDGDQLFPSARVDANGMLHIAFVDHRNNQNLPVFDIYYANSGDGVKFSRNLRVSEDPITNNPAGGRTIGDYLDMVVAYPGLVYIAYPCGQSQYGPTSACMAQVDPRLVK